MRTITESESTPKADGFFMPAEFAPQDRVWMGWPHRTDTWAHGAKPAQKQYAAIARAISEFTPVYMCANQVDYANCKAVFENDENVTVIEMTTDDAWFRDTAATYVINGKGEKRANHWHPTAAQRMREVWFYLIHLFDDAEKLNKQLRRFRTPAEYERIQAEILASCPIRSDVQGDLI